MPLSVVTCGTKDLAGDVAARYGASLICKAIRENGKANVILATGASQFEMLRTLVTCSEVDWTKVTCIHLDEYVGIGIDHPASFRKYLRERFVDQLPVAPAAFHYVDGSGDAEAECKRLEAVLAGVTIDVAFVGIGENGHLAFNDPPCNMEVSDAFIVVDLDQKCREQQLGEGWFATLADVPTKAISMSMTQILKSKAIVCTVPDERKAAAVKATIESDKPSVDVPASFMQNHSATTLFLDGNSASLLSK